MVNILPQKTLWTWWCECGKETNLQIQSTLSHVLSKVGTRELRASSLIMMVTVAHTQVDFPCFPYILILTVSKVSLISYHVTVTLSSYHFSGTFPQNRPQSLCFPKNALKIWRVCITQKESSFQCLPAPLPHLCLVEQPQYTCSTSIKGNLKVVKQIRWDMQKPQRR